MLKEIGVDYDVLKTVGTITPTTIPGIIRNYPQVIPNGLYQKLVNNMRDFTIDVFKDFINGIVVNVVASKLFSGISKMPRLTRLPLRYGLFLIPFGWDYPNLKKDVDEYLRTV